MDDSADRKWLVAARKQAKTLMLDPKADTSVQNAQGLRRMIAEHQDENILIPVSAASDVFDVLSACLPVRDGAPMHKVAFISPMSKEIIDTFCAAFGGGEGTLEEREKPTYATGAAKPKTEKEQAKPSAFWGRGAHARRYAAVAKQLKKARYYQWRTKRRERQLYCFRSLERPQVLALRRQMDFCMHVLEFRFRSIPECPAPLCKLEGCYRYHVQRRGCSG